MPSVRNVKVTIGGPESPAGTAATREYVVPHRGLPNIRPAFTKEPDPAITGDNMRRGKYVMAGDVSGPLPLAFRPCGGIGQILNSLLGQELTPTQIGAAIRIRYIGTEASCKLSANTSGDTLTSEIGDLGSESGDAAFGTSGDIDLTAAATDTVGELVAVINAYTYYECEKMFGADAVDAADIIDITQAQAKSGWVVVRFSSATTGIYEHRWPVVLANTERPAYSLQIDGRQDNFLYDGCVVDSLSLSAAIKAFVESEAQIMGMEETGAQVASALTLEDVDPLRFHSGAFSIGETDWTYIRNHSIAIGNGHNAEGFGKGSIYRAYHEKGMFSVTGDVQLRLDSDADALRDYINSTDLIALYFDYEGKALDANINEMIWVEMPYCSIDEYEWVENGDVIDVRIPFEVIYKKGSPYNHPFTVSMLTGDSAAY